MHGKSDHRDSFVHWAFRVPFDRNLQSIMSVYPFGIPLQTKPGILWYTSMSTSVSYPGLPFNTLFSLVVIPLRPRSRSLRYCHSRQRPFKSSLLFPSRLLPSISVSRLCFSTSPNPVFLSRLPPLPRLFSSIPYASSPWPSLRSGTLTRISQRYLWSAHLIAEKPSNRMRNHHDARSCEANHDAVEVGGFVDGRPAEVVEGPLEEGRRGL